MRNLTKRDLICQLQVDLSRRFGDEQFLVEELAGIVQALVNSIRRTALLSSEYNDWQAVSQLITQDHFCNEFMDRKQIVKRIENTSGLNPEMSDYALSAIETRVDREIEQESAIEMEHIGLIESEELPRYTIHLNNELRIAPPMADNFEEHVISHLER